MLKKLSKRKAKFAQGKTYQKLHRVSQWISLALTIVLIPILMSNLWFIYQKEVQKEVRPNLFGYTPLAVLTDSMTGKLADSIHKGDVIIVKKMDKKAVDQLKIGDVIAFSESDNQTVTHRVYDIDKTANQEIEKIYTKGDMNKSPDEGSITPKQLVGKYVLKIQGLAYFFDFIRTPLGLLVLVVLPLFIVTILFKNTIIIKKEGEKDETINQNK